MSPDYLIVGAGIIGLTFARALKTSRPHASVVVLEKDSYVGAHASGRNSGIVHAGIYYAPGSLKARLCVEGARKLKAYCREHKLPLAESGKVILPTMPGDDERLLELHRRAQANGVETEVIDDATLTKLEPEAAPVERSLFCPATAAIEPMAVLDRLLEDLGELGVVVTFGVEVTSVDALKKEVRLSTGGSLSYGMLVNAAGSFADKLAHQMRVGLHLSLIPFRGEYFEVPPSAALTLRRQVYPVPVPELPFLGVHMTVACSGKIYVGPSAKPALGREHYRGTEGVDWVELPANLWSQAGMFAFDRSGFRRHALVEVRRMRLVNFLGEAQRLVPRLKFEHLRPSKKRGIRAQLYDAQKRALEMDFVVLDGPSSLHVLNAVSPGFTASFAFADYLVSRLSGPETSP